MMNVGGKDTTEGRQCVINANEGHERERLGSSVYIYTTCLCSPEVKWLLSSTNLAICSSVHLTLLRHTPALQIMPRAYAAN